MSRPRAPRSGTAEGLEQLRALSHPLRLRLLELFARRPMTTKQAAEELGEPPTRLYHHVAALERAGLVRLRETRQNRGTTEKYFETVANRFVAARGEAGRGGAHRLAPAAERRRGGLGKATAARRLATLRAHHRAHPSRRA